MSTEEFLSTTPVEINWKIEAQNNAKEEQHHLIYVLGRLSSMAMVEKFPTFDEVFPTTEIKDSREIERKTALKALGRAGLPTENF